VLENQIVFDPRESAMMEAAARHQAGREESGFRNVVLKRCLTTVRLREPSGSQDRYWAWVRS